MQILGHKNIKNTLIYTQSVTSEDDDCVCKAAANVKEAAELIETGYICLRHGKHQTVQKTQMNITYFQT